MLTQDDAAALFKELLPAQDESYMLGLILGLSPQEVKSIHFSYTEPVVAVLVLFSSREHQEHRHSDRCHMTVLPWRWRRQLWLPRATTNQAQMMTRHGRPFSPPPSPFPLSDLAISTGYV